MNAPTHATPTRLCPTCGKPVIEPRWRPFCSSRCKQVDLGRWLTESYVLPGQDGEALLDPDADAGP